MSYNILIVDDSSTTRAMIKRTLKLAEIDVTSFHEACDGKAALEVLAANRVDLVLADLNMPNMGGVEMTVLMRMDAKTRDVPVIVISAEPNVHLLEELKHDGIQGYVRKPFTPENIRNVINQVLGVTHA
jgi:two-component system chemotaxis response regulator CheY